MIDKLQLISCEYMSNIAEFFIGVLASESWWEAW